MNDENKKINIRAELNLVDETWKESDVLFSQKLFKGCISRTYYAAFHGARALLLSKGFDPSSHKGVLHLLQLHFIRPGIIEPEYGRIFSKAQKFREESDYLPAAMFSEKDAQVERKEVKSFINRVKRHLQDEGFI